jgi:hypothetical protein
LVLLLLLQEVVVQQSGWMGFLRGLGWAVLLSLM